MRRSTALSLPLQLVIPWIREALLKGRISTVDLLVLTSLDQLLFKLKLYFSFLTKQSQ
jgi:hypothetical protein